MKDFLLKNWVLLAILAIAAFFRFWQIGQLPGGLFPDEAANGLDVNSIFNGDVKPFYERGNGREALFFYFLAIPVAIFGRGPWQHHIVSAAFGLMSVLATYFLAKRMFTKNVALLASFFLAVSSYAVTISRTAFRANTVPLFATLTVLFLIKLLQEKDEKGRLLSAFFAGISFGLGFYTYISFRMMLPLIIVFKIILLLALRDRVIELIKRYWKIKLAAIGGFIIAFSWIGIYFLTHSGSFVGRAGQVSIFSPDLNKGDLVGTFIDVFQKTMLSFFATGDLNWRHNVSGYPFLSAFLSPFFALALVVFTFSILRLLKQAWQKQINHNTLFQAIVAVWFWFMLAPEVTTAEGIPHGLRLIGVIPPIFIMSAWGVNKLWEKISQTQYFYRSKVIFATIFLSTIFLYNFYLYFAYAANSPEYYYSFRSDLTTVSEYLNQRNNKQQTYLALDAFSVQTVEYFTTENQQPYMLTIPENSYLVSLKKGDQVVFTQSTLFDIKKFIQHHPDVKLAKEEKNKFGEKIMVVLEQQ